MMCGEAAVETGPRDNLASGFPVVEVHRSVPHDCSVSMPLAAREHGVIRSRVMDPQRIAVR